MRKSLAQIIICWIVAATFVVLQAGAGTIPVRPGTAPPAPASHALLVSDTMDCRMCAPLPAASGACVANFCLKADMKLQAGLANRQDRPVFSLVAARVPAGFVSRPPTRPA